MKYLAQKLIHLGLSSLESQVYLGLLERQLTTAGALAKHLGIKRSTVYTILETLIEKGLISLTKIGHVKHYQAESIHRLQEWLEAERHKLEEKEKVLNEIQLDLEKLSEKQIQAPQISIYEGQKGVNALLMQNLDEHPDEILVLGGYMKDEDLIPEYTKRRIQMKIPVELLVPDSPFTRSCKAKDKMELRKTLLLDEAHRFPASIHIHKESISLFTFSEKDSVGVNIRNKDISETLKILFKLTFSLYKENDELHD